MLSQKAIEQNQINSAKRENARVEKLRKNAIKSLKNNDDEQAFRDILSAWRLDSAEIDDVRNYALYVHE